MIGINDHLHPRLVYEYGGLTFELSAVIDLYESAYGTRSAALVSCSRSLLECGYPCN